ncbi:MAG: hypothetical protein U0T82_13105 [Bacteroidales bacterium]
MDNKVKYDYEASVGGALSTGWRVMSDSFLYLFLVVIIMAFVNAPSGLMQFNFDPSQHNFNWGDFHFDHMPFGDFDFVNPLVAALGAAAIFLALLAFAYSVLVKPIFEYGSDMIFVQAARGTKPDFNTLVNGFRENYFHIVLANLLTVALIMLGFFACIIPGIILACRLVFVSYLVMDKKLDPIAAIETSWKMTRGHGWTVFFLGFTSLWIGVAGFLLCIVGIFPAIIWIGSSFAALYESILRLNAPAETVQEAPVIA